MPSAFTTVCGKSSVALNPYRLKFSLVPKRDKLFELIAVLLITGIACALDEELFSKYCFAASSI